MEMSAMPLSEGTTIRPAVTPAEMQAMVVSQDQEAVALFSDLFSQMGVGVQRYAEESTAIARLAMARFEAVVVDCDSIGDIVLLVRRIRESPSSKNALVFAVATTTDVRQQALQLGSNFVVERPFERQRITSILHIAYGLMLQDRRRYFRHTISAPVRLRRTSGEELQCTTLNISRNGTAVCVPSTLELGEPLEITFAIPGVDCVINARGAVIWHDKHGKAGLRFECSNADDRDRLEAWLDAQFGHQFNRVPS